MDDDSCCRECGRYSRAGLIACYDCHILLCGKCAKLVYCYMVCIEHRVERERSREQKND